MIIIYSRRERAMYRVILSFGRISGIKISFEQEICRQELKLKFIESNWDLKKHSIEIT